MTDQVKVYCDERGAYHDGRGRTWVETFERLPAERAERAGRSWGAVPPERGRHAKFGPGSGDSVLPFHRSSEVAVTEVADSGVTWPVQYVGTSSMLGDFVGSEGEHRRTRDGRPVFTGPTEAGTDDFRSADYLGDVHSEVRHWSYALRCPCGLAVQVRGERLWPLLEQMHAGGMHEVSLSRLARIVS